MLAARACRGTARCCARCALAVVALALAVRRRRRGRVRRAGGSLFNTALNANQRFFRVNSLFYDPNIFGRFLALTMVLVAAAMLWERDRRASRSPPRPCSRSLWLGAARHGLAVEHGRAARRASP